MAVDQLMWHIVGIEIRFDFLHTYDRLNMYKNIVTITRTDIVPNEAIKLCPLLHPSVPQ